MIRTRTLERQAAILGRAAEWPARPPGGAPAARPRGPAKAPVNEVGRPSGSLEPFGASPRPAPPPWGSLGELRLLHSSASRQTRSTSSRNPMPAACAALGRRLVAVNPGIVFISMHMGMPSEPSR